MDIFMFYATTASLVVVFLSFSLHLVFNKFNPSVKGKLPIPPGKKGWPVFGETFEFLSTGWKGRPEKFFFDRMAKYSSQVFRTSLMLEDAAVFCGAAGNKFLFSNENKLVRIWWPSSVKKIFPNNQTSKAGHIKMQRFLPNIFKAEGLQRYVPIMDLLTQKHFQAEWEGKEKILTSKVARKFSFSVACKIFLSIEEPERLDYLLGPFESISHGILSIPIDLPGTACRRGINGANFTRKVLIAIIRQRKSDLAEAKVSATQDILSHLLLFTDEDGDSFSEAYIADKILGLLIAGHESTSSVCTLVVKYLAELPEVYEGVYKEQMEIAKSKGPEELLNWNDVSKMKYSWNVACEVLRLAPPLQGNFREAITDFVYNGYSIPKGWKLYWSSISTHKNPEYFPKPEEFDPSRFDGKGPAPYTFIPFGGGPHMCPGKEYARIEILLFMHHLVRKFKCEKLLSNEEIVVNPGPMPAMGLPIRIYPHKDNC